MPETTTTRPVPQVRPVRSRSDGDADSASWESKQPVRVRLVQAGSVRVRLIQEQPIPEQIAEQ
jgi:hypothetical protein